MLVILWVQVEYKYCPYEHTEGQVFVFFFQQQMLKYSQSWQGKCTDTWRKLLVPYLTHWNNLCDDIFISVESNMVLKRPLAQMCTTKLCVGVFCSPHRLVV